jgi:O-antigen/teichoic acid export membrane protein
VRNLFISIINTKTIQQSAVTLVGTAINGILGLIFYILIARQLGPEQFGNISLAITVLTLTADIADFGTNSGITRFVPKFLVDDPTRSKRILKMTLQFKFAAYVVVLLLGLVTAPFIATHVFSKPELASLLQFSFIGVGGAMLFSLASTALQSMQKFGHWSIVNITSNLLRLVIVSILVLQQYLDSTTILATYIAVPFFGFLLASLFLPVRQIIYSKDTWSDRGIFFRYNRWVAVNILIAAFASRMDLLLIGRLLSSVELGIYAAANQLISMLPQLIGALGSVAAPKLASFTEDDQMMTYFKKFQLFTGLLAVIGLICLPLLWFVIPIILGSAYIASLPIFSILFIAMMIFLLSIPVNMAITYYFEEPQFFIVTSMINLFIMIIVGYAAISIFGVLGAAGTVLSGMIVNYVLSLVYFRKKARR